MGLTYLDVTFRNGKPFAAYLQLPRRPGDKSARSEKVEAGMVVDFATDGRAIGVEITAPAQCDITTLNRILAAHGIGPVTARDLGPLVAA